MCKLCAAVPSGLRKAAAMMKEWIAVACGGMLGAVLRHALSGVFSLISPAWLPIATLVANVLGCLAIGALAQWSFHQQLSSHWWVVGARVGLLGGLTTFSSFGLDIVRLWQTQRTSHSMALAAAHLILGLMAIAIGMSLARADPQVAESA